MNGIVQSIGYAYLGCIKNAGDNTHINTFIIIGKSGNKNLYFLSLIAKAIKITKNQKYAPAFTVKPKIGIRLKTFIHLIITLDNGFKKSG